MKFLPKRALELSRFISCKTHFEIFIPILSLSQTTVELLKLSLFGQKQKFVFKK